MKRVTLAIETSGAVGSVAAGLEGQMIYQGSYQSGRSHNSELFTHLKKALEALAADEIEHSQVSNILVGVGPGSNTGIRIALSAAQALSMGSVADIVALPSAFSLSQKRPFLVCGDAMRGSAFIVEVQSLGEPVKANFLPYEELFKEGRVPEGWNPEGRPVFFERAILERAEKENREEVGSKSLTQEGNLYEPVAAGLIDYWSGLDEQSRLVARKQPSLPIYLREAFVTQQQP